MTQQIPNLMEPTLSTLLISGNGYVRAGDVLALASTPVSTPVSTPALSVGSLYARDMMPGLNVPTANPVLTAKLLGDLGCRKVRIQLVRDNTGDMAALQNAMSGYSNPNLQINVMLNGYMQDAVNNPLTEQEPLLVKLAGIKGPNGRTILHSIEGPNEINNPYVGQGSRGPNDATNKTDNTIGGPVAPGGASSPIAIANFNDWVQSLYDLRARHPELAAIPLYSPTILNYTGTPFTGMLGKVDAAAMHYYAGVTGTGGDPDRIGSPGDMSHIYDYHQTAILPGGRVVMTECGASTESGTGGYSLRGQARYALLNHVDFYRKPGALEFYWYNSFNNPVSTQASQTSDPQDNFGLAYPDGTLKPAGIVQRNFVDLLSLGLNYDDSRNAADTMPFSPGYDPSRLNVSGATPGGGCLVAHKSDGSSLVIPWNEPPIDTGGAATSPVACPITIDLGIPCNWRLYDPTGGGGVADFTAARHLTPLAQGSSQVVNATLYGMPLVLEIAASVGAAGMMQTFSYLPSRDGVGL